MDYVLKTNALSKNYGHFKALNGLSMNVPKGAIYGFVGKNGAGKTTLIRLICGLQNPSSGDYILYGRKNMEKEIVKSQLSLDAGRAAGYNEITPKRGIHSGMEVKNED